MVALSLLCLVAPPAQAHGIAVDGDAMDWTGVVVVGGDYDTQAGEWGWRPADSAYPLQEFRVTADSSYVYFLVRFAEVRATRGEGAPLLQIAMDTDQQPNSGKDVFAGFSRSRLAANATWERLIRTSFGAGRLTPGILDGNFTDLATNEDLMILNPTKRTLEMRIRWAALAVAPPTTLRFTVALFTADRRDNVAPEGSAAEAVLIPTGRPSPTDRLDVAFDVAFRANGDALPPPAPVRIGPWSLPIPLALRNPMLYAAVAGVLLIVIGILLKLRGRPRSWWWG